MCVCVCVCVCTCVCALMYKCLCMKYTGIRTPLSFQRTHLSLHVYMCSLVAYIHVFSRCIYTWVLCMILNLLGFMCTCFTVRYLCTYLSRCIYICVLCIISMHTYTCACMRMRTSACVDAHIYICMYIHVYIFMYVHMYSHDS